MVFLQNGYGGESVVGRVVVAKVDSIVVPAFPLVEIVIKLTFVAAFLFVVFVSIFNGIFSSFSFIFHATSYNRKVMI